jgi:hypothetical protein
MGRSEGGRIICCWFMSSAGCLPGRNCVGELTSPGKPFSMSKVEVRGRVGRSRQIRGAPGAAGQPIGGFAADLADNLFKDLEPDVAGQLLAARGESSADPRAAWRGSAAARRAGGRGPDRPDGGGQADRGEGRAGLPPRFSWLPAGPAGPGRGRGRPAALLAARPGHGPGRAGVLRTASRTTSSSRRCRPAAPSRG